jgi:hypothetical protein
VYERNINRSNKNHQFFFFLLSSCNFQQEAPAVGFESTLFGFVNDGSAISATVLGINLSLYF